MTKRIPAPNIMLMGDSGTGKTHSIGTFLGHFEDGKWVQDDTPFEVFCLFTEPGMEVLAEFPDDRLHWHFVPPATPSWDTMLKNQTRINKSTAKDLANLEDMSKTSYPQFLELLKSFANFECQRTGKSFGDVTGWDQTKVLVLDSMSGLALMCMQHVAGGKPVKSQQNWSMAMGAIEDLVNKLCMDTTCWFVMACHVEKEVDEVTGQQQIMASTLGRKLAPKLPRFFSEVIQSQRIGTEFFWTTAAPAAATKARMLPWSQKLQPNFQPIVKRWVELAAK